MMLMIVMMMMIVMIMVRLIDFFSHTGTMRSTTTNQVEWVDHDQTRTLIVERSVGEESSGRRDRRDGNAATRHLYLNDDDDSDDDDIDDSDDDDSDDDSDDDDSDDDDDDDDDDDGG